ncbi:hypothetical protein NDU88_005338 [Pleurodeles waltl]|uniref:Uncharacterized protein n=1 Tax=Pleurodeles waltl TaxID=8319 RepID=A0AAV7M919_PLEWA|nr:hypothetical protein NDU88_005338 [Pleurodeles waltl]
MQDVKERQLGSRAAETIGTAQGVGLDLFRLKKKKKGKLNVVSAAARATRISLVDGTRSGAAHASRFLGVPGARVVRKECRTSRSSSWGAERHREDRRCSGVIRFGHFQYAMTLKQENKHSFFYKHRFLTDLSPESKWWCLKGMKK